MPSGMELMLKSFGIDPEKIKVELTNTLNNATGVVKDEVAKLHTKIDNTQASLTRVEMMLSAIMQHYGIVGISGAFDNKPADKVGEQFEERMISNGNNAASTD